MLPKETSHAILSRGHPRSLVSVSHYVPVATDLSRCRAHCALHVVNGCGTRETGVCRAPQPGTPLLGACWGRGGHHRDTRHTRANGWRAWDVAVYKSPGG